MGGRFMEDEVLFRTKGKDVIFDHLVVYVLRKAGRMGEDHAFQGFQLDLFRLDLLLPLGRSVLFHASLEVRLSRAFLAIPICQRTQLVSRKRASRISASRLPLNLP